MLEITPAAIRKRVFKPHLYEMLLEKSILRVLAPYLDKNKLTLDVGGNTGHQAYFQADHSKEVYTYEPVDVVYKQLKKIEEQKDNVTAFNLAVSDFCGKATFYVDHLRLSNSGFQNNVNGPTIEVDVVTIDSLNLSNIGFIKIDVEGTELDVLMGAVVTIERDRPNCMIEIYEPFSKHPLNAIFDFMFDRDYACFYYDHNVPEGLVPVLNTEEGVCAVEHKHEAHDGDFLFSSN